MGNGEVTGRSKSEAGRRKRWQRAEGIGHVKRLECGSRNAASGQ